MSCYPVRFFFGKGYWGGNNENQRAGKDPTEVKFDKKVDYYELLGVDKLASES